MDFHQPTIDLLSAISKERQKAGGIYMTPKSVRDVLMNKLPPMEYPLILEPSCGTGEFLISARVKYPDAIIRAIEKEPDLSGVAVEQAPFAKVITGDALDPNPEPRYDFVIGNPPFYEFQPNADQIKKFSDIIYGRPNIYSFFIKLGIDCLKPNGHLAYVLPPAMNNGAYFKKLRQYIIKHTNIKSITILDSSNLFHKATQKVMILVLKKEKNTGDFIVERNGITIFSQEADKLDQMSQGSTSLNELGYSVATGQIVWNQNKGNLTDDSSHMPLLWSYNIVGNKLKFPITKKNKPQYVKTDIVNSGPAVIVNRITGAAKDATIKTAYIPRGFKFVGENHVNVITGHSKLITLKQIHKQLIDPKSTEFLKHLTGNTQMSSKELQYMIPIHIYKAG